MKKPNFGANFDKNLIFMTKTVKIKTLLLKALITMVNKSLPLSKFGHFTKKIGFSSKLAPNFCFFIKLTKKII